MKHFSRHETYMKYKQKSCVYSPASVITNCRATSSILSQPKQNQKIIDRFPPPTRRFFFGVLSPQNVRNLVRLLRIDSALENNSLNIDRKEKKREVFFTVLTGCDIDIIVNGA